MRIKTAAERLFLLHSHDALVILKHSLSLPKLLFTLRSSYCADHPALQVFDNVLRDSLRRILNISLEDTSWLQASQPVKWGGLGIRSATISRLLPTWLQRMVLHP